MGHERPTFRAEMHQNNSHCNQRYLPRFDLTAFKTLKDVCKTTLNFEGKNIQLHSEFLKFPFSFLNI